MTFRHHLSLGALLVSSYVLCSGLAVAQSAPFVFRAGTGGYASYRIPAIVLSEDKTLLAFCEGRVRSAADHGDIDIVLRRSRDGGLTWGEQLVVSDDGAHTCGNPAPVVLPSGRILLLSCGSTGSEQQNMHGGVPREVYVQYSDDEGLTWSARRRITEEAKQADWGWFATGPCNAIVLRHGKHKGRILIPSNHSAKQGDKVVYQGSCFYSDDEGQTWKRGQITQKNLSANESAIAEVGADLVLQSFRAQSGRGIRLQRYSRDGGATWNIEEEMPELPHVVCQGSLIADGTRERTLYFSSPGVKKKRQNLTVFQSSDGGKSWPHSRCLREGSHGYSNLVEIDHETLGVLYESGSTVKEDYSRGGIVFELVKKDTLQSK